MADEAGELGSEVAVTPELIDAALEGQAPKVGKPGQDDALVAARRTQAVTLRLAGMTYEQIAERLHYANRQAARQVVVAALRQVEVANVRELREVENARLERATAALWPKVLGGDVRATEAWLKVSERLSKLNGLDAPTQLQISSGVQAELSDALSLLQQAVVGEDGAFEVTHVGSDDDA